jgi:hypothetical protein
MSYNINNTSSTIDFVNTIEYKRELKREIEKLRKDEHLEIFKIIKTETNSYTENNNGIFINLKNLDTPVLFKIGNFVKYCKENVEKFYKYEDLKKNIMNDSISLENDTSSRDIDEDYDNYHIEDKPNTEEDLINDIKNLGVEEDTKSLESFKYPKLINKNPKLYGVGNRLIKKCKSMDSQILSSGFSISEIGKDGENILELYRKDELKLDKI